MEKNSPFTIAKLALLDEQMEIRPAEIEDAWIRTQGKWPRSSPSMISRWGLPLTAAAAVTALVAFAPTGRVWAESLWTKFVLTRTLNIQIDWNRTAPQLLLPNVFPMFPQDQAVKWTPDSLEAASALAGFAVRKLTSPTSPQPLTIQIIEQPGIERVFDLAAVRADLARVGRAMPVLPEGMDGAHITLETQGRSVVSRYGACPELIGPWKACAMLIQSRPMILKLPPALDPADYVRFSWELAGIPASDVRALQAMAGGRPVLSMPMETAAEARYLPVRGTAGMLLIYPASANGEVAYELHWQEDGFEFRLFGRDPAAASSVVNSLR